MRNFEYYTPTRIIFGKDTHLQTASLLKEYGAHKVLIHYGGQSAVRSGLIDEITANLKAPVVINVNENLGEQVIIDKEKYKIKHPLVKE